ncbi:MAG: butyrate kinase [Clostridiaceae bacterium]
MEYNILAINPGSTSTKIAVYENQVEIISTTINTPPSLENFNNDIGEYDSTKSLVLNFLKEKNYNINKLSAVVGRGGMLPPVKSGAYLVNDMMIDRLKNRPIITHASNLGAIIAYEIAKPLNINAYIYDSVAVDELSDIARISGLLDIPRISLSHALNSRAMAIKAAKLNNKEYKNMNIIVAHLGGGISISLHSYGKMIDLVSDDEGPFSPERSGRVPCGHFMDLCFSNKYTYKEIKSKLRGTGGLYSYLNTKDTIKVQNMILNGDEKAKLIFEAMGYQIAKGIGELATVVDGQIDCIVLTGGMAHSNMLTSFVEKKISFISKVIILPGENELESLAFGVLRVLRKEEKAREYIEKADI